MDSDSLLGTTDSDSLWSTLGLSWVRQLPADLVAVLAFTLLTLGSVFLPGLSETPLRVVLGYPFMLFVTGYALVAALFPEASDVQDGGLTVVQRVGLSFATSIVVVASTGLVLNASPVGIRVVPVLGTVSVVVVGLVILAARRRFALPAHERFVVQWRGRLAGLYTELSSPDDRTDALLNVTLVFTLLVAASSVGYAVAVPTEGQAYTELYLLTENEGELVAADYPSEFTAGEPQSLVVGIGNREHEPVSYTLLVDIQRVRSEGESMQVLETERLARFQPQLAANETWHREHEIAPTMVGEQLRITYLLYRGSPPAEPTMDNAYRKLHIWVNVTAP